MEVIMGFLAMIILGFISSTLFLFAFLTWNKGGESPAKEFWRKRGQEEKRERELLDDPVFFDDNKPSRHFLSKHGEIDNIYYVAFDPIEIEDSEDGLKYLEDGTEAYDENYDVVQSLSAKEHPLSVNIDDLISHYDYNQENENEISEVDHRFLVYSNGVFIRDSHGKVKLNISHQNRMHYLHHIPPEDSIVLREVNEILRGIHKEEWEMENSKVR